MMMFLGMVDRRKAFSFISSQHHCQRSSSSRVSDMPLARFEPVQNLNSGLFKWSCAVVITTTTWRHRFIKLNFSAFFSFCKISVSTIGILSLTTIPISSVTVILGSSISIFLGLRACSRAVSRFFFQTTTMMNFLAAACNFDSGIAFFVTEETGNPVRIHWIIGAFTCAQWKNNNTCHFALKVVLSQQYFTSLSCWNCQMNK